MDRDAVAKWEADGTGPCPYCGSENIDYGDIVSDVGIGEGGWVTDSFFCGDCSAQWAVTANVRVASRMVETR